MEYRITVKDPNGKRLKRRTVEVMEASASEAIAALLRAEPDAEILDVARKFNPPPATPKFLAYGDE